MFRSANPIAVNRLPRAHAKFAFRALASRALGLLLTFAAVGSSNLGAQQTSVPAAPKLPTIPLASILPDKPKVPAATQELPPALPESPTAIPLPDVAPRSQALAALLRDAAAKLASQEQLDSIQTAIAGLEPSLETKEQEVNTLLSGTPNSLEVREEENFWRGMQAYTADWKQQLLGWANDAQKDVDLLNAQEPIWAATLEENKGNADLGPVLSVIEGNLAEIRRLRKRAKDTLQVVVNLQIKVGEIDQTSADTISRLALANSKLKGHLLDRDSLPLWKVTARREIGESSVVFHSASSRWISVQTFLKENVGVIVFLFLFAVCSVLFARHLHQLVGDRQPADELEADAYRILSHWFAVGLLPPLIFGYVLAPSAPVTLLGLLIIVSFFPILVVLPSLLHRRLRLLLYLFVGIYGINWAIAWLGFNPSTRREVQFVTNLILFCVLAYLIRPSRNLPRQATRWGRVILFVIRVGVGLLGVALLADLFGYLKLAHYLVLACIYSGVVTIGVVTGVRVAILLVTVGLRSPAAERIAAVRLHREGIARWLPRALQWTGVLVWAWSATALLGFDDALRDSLGTLLDFHIVGGTSGATLGGLLGLFAVLVLGYTVANAIRFFFREEVFRRFHMSRGLPELISSLIYYLLMLIIVLVAINTAGIELNKFTVLTGAFGVGIGFGLQNIINNFVSGLILQFERPIHINDILEVDNNTGKVTRIGIRSSTIQTFQGAEVIIPNATLISNKVINWTLSESQRRRELPVGVAYGTDPKIVLKILRDAAAKHELVLTKPEPMSYFKGFGESSLDFELHFWVMQENNGLLITSEVAMDAMRMFEDAGIEIPFPQRDLRLRALDPAAASALMTAETNGLLSPPEPSYEPVARKAERTRGSASD